MLASLRQCQNGCAQRPVASSAEQLGSSSQRCVSFHSRLSSCSAMFNTAPSCCSLWQVLFFGYSTLDAILAGVNGGEMRGADPKVALDAIMLLGAKLAATSICLGAGLVGGTFAPSLFLGAVLGVAFHAAANFGLDAAIDSLAQVSAIKHLVS